MHRTVETEIWDDPKFCEKGHHTLLLALHLFTCPESHVTGLYRFRLSVAREKSQLPPKMFDAAFKILLDPDIDFCRYDSVRKVIFVVNMWKRQPHHGIHIDRIPYHFRTLFESPLINDWLDKYKEYQVDFPRVTLPSPTRHQPVTTSSPPDTGFRIQDLGERNNPPTPLEGAVPTRWPLLKKPEDIQKQLDKLDLEPFKAKWEPEGVDVDRVYESFCKYALEGSPKKPRPNPSNWRRWDQAFDNSCEMAANRITKYGGQNTQSTRSFVRNALRGVE
jgi:hypothetical protein